MNESLVKKNDKTVACWLLLGVVMLLVQILLGGITRLTGSGLSITEWNVVTGAIPPLSNTAWIQEFDKYKQTPQFKLLNSGFDLSDFKFIFFWEWLHRLWARTVGVVFLIGFVWLLAAGRIRASMIKPLLILFLLGALQGAVGWIMVASGLTGDATYVRPTRLALHFVFALVLVCYTFWFALDLLANERVSVSHPSSRRGLWFLLTLLGLQLTYGALMAGHHAASIAPTWPTLNGDWIPPRLFTKAPILANLIENKMTVQFIHRFLAYTLLLATAIWTLQSRRIPENLHRFSQAKWIPLILVSLQVLLGILTLLVSPQIVINHWTLFDWSALSHQLVAILFLLSLVYLAHCLRPVRSFA